MRSNHEHSRFHVLSGLHKTFVSLRRHWYLDARVCTAQTSSITFFRFLCFVEFNLTADVGFIARPWAKKLCRLSPCMNNSVSLYECQPEAPEIRQPLQARLEFFYQGSHINETGVPNVMSYGSVSHALPSLSDLALGVYTRSDTKLMTLSLW